jgi:polar amino acid transport system substrate-binding protein
MRRVRTVLGGWAFLGIAAALAAQTARPPLPDREWKVGVFESPPYAMHEADGQWRGLIVDMWKELAAELNIRYRFGEASPDTLLDDIAHGRLDVGVGPFAATLDRERVIDFSHIFLVTGTGIAIRAGSDEERWLSVLRALTAPGAIRVYLGVAFLLFLAGGVLWTLERKRNPQFSIRTWPGIGAGFWWAGVTTVGVGYGDKVPITFWGRILALLWMFMSLVLVTSLTAFVTAKLAVAEFGQFRGAASLRNSHVGTVEGSASSDFLRNQGVRRTVYASPAEAITALRDHKVEAVVYGVVTLRYYAERDPKKDIDIFPDLIDQQSLAFPLPDGSPLRAPINDALRHFMIQSKWRDMQDKYLGPEMTPVSAPR